MRVDPRCMSFPPFSPGRDWFNDSGVRIVPEEPLVPCLAELALSDLERSLLGRIDDQSIAVDALIGKCQQHDPPAMSSPRRAYSSSNDWFGGCRDIRSQRVGRSRLSSRRGDARTLWTGLGWIGKSLELDLTAGTASAEKPKYGITPAKFGQSARSRLLRWERGEGNLTSLLPEGRRRIHRAMPGAATPVERARVQVIPKGDAASPRFEPPGAAAALAVTIHEFPSPSPGAAPTRSTAGPDGNVWFTDSANEIATDQSDDPRHHRVPGSRLPTAFPSAITVGPTASSGLHRVKRPPDRGNQPDDARHRPVSPSPRPLPIPMRSIRPGPMATFWFTEGGTNQIGMINPMTHAIGPVHYPQSPNSFPVGITGGPDGNLWFTENGEDQIGTINPTTHVITEFPAPTSSSGPGCRITTGPDGNL